MLYQQACDLFNHPFIETIKGNCPHSVYSWLVDKTSMTARLETHCQHLRVEVFREGSILVESLSEEEQIALLPFNAKRYWCREVQLLGDDIPWLVGRTVVPEDSLQGQAVDLKTIGDQPLGRLLFNSAQLSRDYLMAGSLGDLWSRRSLLRLAGSPLLLTEIFLPASPLYSPLAQGTPQCKP